MRAFITGSTGLLGSNLVAQLLAQGYAVRALARSREKARRQLGTHPALEVIEGDLGDVPAFAHYLAGCDLLVHTAAYFREYFGRGDHWPALRRYNVDATIELLTAAESAGVARAVHISSSGVIGAEHDEVVDETSPPGPLQATNLYFKSKVLAEAAIAEWRRSHAMPVVLVLPTWMWGPGDAAPTSAGRLVQDFLERRLPGIVPGAANVVDARDVAAGTIAAATHGRDGERYILTGRRATLAELLRLLEAASGVPGPRLPIPYPMALLTAYGAEALARLRGTETLITVAGVRTLQDRATYSAARAQTELGFTARPLETTVADAVAWCRGPRSLAPVAGAAAA
jgi:dihydroflavonol-4-reductase